MVSTALSLTLPTAAIADEQRRCEEYEVECANAKQRNALQEYYRTHARVALGKEQRLSNGVAWRLLIDATHDVAFPRITWMPDRKAMLKANRMFDTLHGGLLRHLQPTNWRRRYSDVTWPEWEKPSLDRQQMMALTYATSRLAAFFEVRGSATEQGGGVTLAGHVLDLDQEKFLSPKTCDGKELWFGSKLVRFGELFEVCDWDAYRAFMALWEKKKSEARESVGHPESDDEFCDREINPYNLSMSQVAFYPTHAGLAIYATSAWPEVFNRCVLTSNAINPIVLPYRDLKPFMATGSLRDELLR
jgi:hypothetical protein